MPLIGLRPEFKTNGKAPEREAFANIIFDVFQFGGLPGCIFLGFIGVCQQGRFVHPFGEVVICHPIDDGMFCPVTEMLSCIGTASIPKAHFGHSVLFWN